MTDTAPQSEKIVIVGYGWVGQANAIALKRLNYEVYYYDVITPRLHYSGAYYGVYEEIKPLQNVRQVDGPDTSYLICIGDRVSAEGVQDISLIAQALESLHGVSGKIILRSTVLPSLLATLAFDIYLPEFLHELYAVEECLNPFYFVVGSRTEGRFPGFLETWKNRAQKVFIGTPDEASRIKYLSNIWNALRVAFVNEFGDSITLPETEAGRARIDRVIDFLFEKKSYLRYGKTFGGHCLPKDLRAYSRETENSRPSPLLRAALQSNLAHQKVVDRYPHVPQWFSAWDYGTFATRALGKAAAVWQKFNKIKAIRYLRAALRPLARWFDRIMWKESTLAESKQKWNTRAVKNPYYFANSDTKSGTQVDEFETRATGLADYTRYLAEDAALRERLGDFKDRTVLEIGCGVGRLTEPLAHSFKTVWGLDISPTMLAIARKRLSALSNINWLETDGNFLPVIDRSVDFVFSYLTFKHLPSVIIAGDYLREISRVLVSGGYAKLHFRTGANVYRRRWFYGVALAPDEVRSLAEQAGLTVIDLKIENSKSLWATLRKGH